LQIFMLFDGKNTKISLFLKVFWFIFCNFTAKYAASNPKLKL